LYQRPTIKGGSNGRIFKLFSYFLIVAHWFGCLWYWVGAQDWCKLSCYENQGANSDGACSWIDASDLGKKNPMCCGCSVVVVVVVAVVRLMVHT
jgi:hypothetical protein|tara:strand:- start:1272 stop:1553 length:282 start_codon:yes stop_codon:yes gene_type:complete